MIGIAVDNVGEYINCFAGVRSGLSMHTDYSIHTGTSDVRCVESLRRILSSSVQISQEDTEFKCSRDIYICTLYTLDTHLLTSFTAIQRQEFSKYNTPQTTLICSSSFTVIRRQESSKYNPSQTTPSMLRYFSPLSEVEDC